MTTDPARITRTPEAEVEFDAASVRALLETQHPDLARLEIRPVRHGWDNFMFRLGDALAVRLPRRQAATNLIRNEQRWLSRLAAQLPLPIPVPLRVGGPTREYPWSWSVLPWLPGESANERPPDASEAESFARFLRALHSIRSPATRAAPPNPLRGVPLADRAETTGVRLERLAARGHRPEPGVERAWHAALEAPAAAAPVWLHGDLHPRNVLVEAGRVAAVVDWGDLTSGDAATDLASIWLLFEDPSARAAALACYAPDEALLLRARGWAIFFAAVFLDTGLVDDPSHAAIGARAFRRLARDLAG